MVKTTARAHKPALIIASIAGGILTVIGVAIWWHFTDPPQQARFHTYRAQLEQLERDFQVAAPSANWRNSFACEPKLSGAWETGVFTCAGRVTGEVAISSITTAQALHDTTYAIVQASPLYGSAVASSIAAVFGDTLAVSTIERQLPKISDISCTYGAYVEPTIDSPLPATPGTLLSAATLRITTVCQGQARSDWYR